MAMKMRFTASAGQAATRLSLWWLFAAYLAHVQSAGFLPLTLRQVSIDADGNGNGVNNNKELAASLENFGYIELKPNGTLLLRSTSDQNDAQSGANLLLFRSVWQAIRLTGGSDSGGVRIRVYGDGVEHKFPPFLERIVQRIQSFFSVYKYADMSRPATAVQPSGATLQPSSAATTTSTTTAELLLEEDSGGSLRPEANTFVDIGGSDDAGTGTGTDVVAAVGPIEYAEFIAIGEHDGYITVGLQ